MSEAIYGLFRSSSSRHQPWQLAAALAMGVSCGLLPKLSFMFCLIAGACALLPIHLPLALLACVSTSLLALASAPLSGRLGVWSLTHPWFSGFWLTLDSYPLIPWLGIHNSVIHGSALLGLGLWLPVFLASRSIACRLASAASANATGWLDPDFRHELKPQVATTYHRARPQPAEPATAVACAAQEPVAQEPQHTRSADQSYLDVEARRIGEHDQADPCHQLEELLEQCRSDDGSQLSVQQVVERAAQMAEFVDELLTNCAAEGFPPSAKRTSQPPQSSAGAPRHAAKISTQHVSELAYSPPDVEEHSPMRPTPALPMVSSQLFVSQPQRSSGGVVVREGDLLKRHHQHAELVVAIPQDIEVASRPAAGVEQQQEALRYLLHHLKAFKDKV